VARQYIQFCWRERLEERCNGLPINRIGRDELTLGCAVLLAQVIADVTGAGFVLHDHFVAAFPAMDDAVQERLAFPRHTSGFVPVVLGVIVTQHGLDFLKNLPVHIGRIFVFQDDSPLLARQLLRKGLCTWSATHGASAAVDEGAGVGGFLST
jgi:hypothetical protein